MKYILTLMMWLLLATSAMAVTHPDEKLADPTLEARALHLTQTLRCVVCQNESIEASRADIARDLRILVRKQIKDGKTDAEILDFLRARYGDYIMLDPPFVGRTVMLWLMPLVVFGIGALLVSPSIRKRGRRT